ncbi:MAG: hypothetical protein WA323_05970 [Candidatus Nitrosopolaris sp.]|jgi:hypothetical protein
MITRCFIGVDVVVEIEELPAAMPATAIIDIKKPHNRTNGIDSDRNICSIFFTEDMIREYS